MSGLASCPTCERTWDESKWCVIDGDVWYYCPVCSQQMDLFDFLDLEVHGVRREPAPSHLPPVGSQLALPWTSVTSLDYDIEC